MRAQPAKLSRPRLHAPVARERLFRRLDDLRAHPVVWITGPPGAGKTTLAASYLDAASVPALWYQADAADSDPATFFLYLRQAVAAAGRKTARPLPLFTPEYLPDIAGFARRFFREAFHRLPAQTQIVLDNYHELSADSPLHAALAAASIEIPADVNLLVISRADPPAAFAEAILGERLSVLPWSELKLTATESDGVAAARGISDTALSARMHAQTDGWFAGLALLLERAKSGVPIRGAVRADALEIVFDFFAQAIFDGASETLQQVLLTAAHLPRVSAALVSRITGVAQAAEHLEALHRRHLFVERTHGASPVYRFHALFRAFLRNRAQSALSPEARFTIMRTAARAMGDEGLHDDAFALWVDAGDWDEAERTLITVAPALLAQGRWRTLLEWGGMFADGHGTPNPWVRYWHGRALVFEDRIAARRLLEQVYETFRAGDDPVGQILCATAVLEALYFHYRDFRAMDAWIERIAALLTSPVTQVPPEDELRVQTALMIAATYRMPEHPILRTARLRVEELLEGPFDANLKVSAAAVLHGYENTTLDVAAGELAVRVARPLLHAPELTRQTAGFYLAMEGYTEYMHGRYEAALARLAESEATVAGDGLKELAVHISHWRALCQRRAGMTDAAEETLRQMEDESASLAAAFAPRQFIKACIAFDRGDYREAVDVVLQAQQVMERGGQFVGTMLVGLVSANILIGSGEHALAEELLDRLRSHVTGPVTDHYLGAIELNSAWLAHRSGDALRRDRHLAESLRRAQEYRARERMRWYPNALADLLPEAFARGIACEIARDLVRDLDIAPRRFDIEQWPWTIRVKTFGRFEVLVDDRPLVFGRKAPRKTLGLLKAIIALGGRDVSEERLIDALWPGEDADAAAQALGAALHRLRRLLGDGDVIRQSAGALSLDRRLCWVDALASERGEGECESDETFLHLYRGAFLDGETSEAWVLPRRERLRGRFVRAVNAVAVRREEARDFEGAMALFERGMAADPLIESFYQGAIRCHLSQGRVAEAGSVYRRLQRTLAVALGAHPSPETRQLVESSIPIE